MLPELIVSQTDHIYTGVINGNDVMSGKNGTQM